MVGGSAYCRNINGIVSYAKFCRNKAIAIDEVSFLLTVEKHMYLYFEVILMVNLFCFIMGSSKSKLVFLLELVL